MSVIVQSKLVLNSKEVRTETLDGRTFLVVPTVIMTNGVRNGSAGPLLYKEEETSKRPDGWNHFPVVVYHPEENGAPVSARTPAVIEKRRVGYVYNAVYNSLVQAETWIDEEKANAVDDRIVPKIRGGETMEISAGYVMDVEVANGEENGEKYVGIARNIRPDHLALLPDMKGACDVAKGCGCGVNVKVNNVDPLLVTNATSFDRTYQAIRDAVSNKFGYYYIRDVYPTFFIYAKDYESKTLYRRDYSINADGVVTLAEGDPVEVKWVTEYRDNKGQFVGNSHKEYPMEKLIKELLALNSDYTAADLEGVKESTLQKMLASAKAKATQPSQTTTTTPAPAAVNNTIQTPPTPRPATMQDWLVANNAPPELYQLLNGAVAAKQSLVANIVAKPGNKLTAEYLATQPLDALQAIDAMLSEQSAAPPSMMGAALPSTAVHNSVKQQPLAAVDLFGRPAKA